MAKWEVATDFCDYRVEQYFMRITLRIKLIFFRGFSCKVSDEESIVSPEHLQQVKPPATPTHHRRGHSESSPLMGRGDFFSNPNKLRHSHSVSAPSPHSQHVHLSGHRPPPKGDPPHSSSSPGSASTSV